IIAFKISEMFHYFWVDFPHLTIFCVKSNRFNYFKFTRRFIYEKDNELFQNSATRPSFSQVVQSKILQNFAVRKNAKQLCEKLKF
ncbi:MAG: hypothetical protein ACRDAX_00095, partial [Propionibacteriaceae bacterium]